MWKKLARMISAALHRQYHPSPGTTKTHLSSRLDVNLSNLELATGHSADVVVRQFTSSGRPMAVVYIDGLADTALINEHILENLLPKKVDSAREGRKYRTAKELIRLIDLPVGEVKTVHTIEQALDRLLCGETILLINGSRVALACQSRGWKARSIEESPTEFLVRGPREAFTEEIRTNTALVRRKIKNPALRVLEMKLGRRTATLINIMYIEGIAQDKLVQEVKRRLGRIDIDGVLESAYLEELIEDAPLSPFPTIAHTEKPDVVAARLLEGRVAIMVDGTPFVLVVPAIFPEFLQSAGDYYERYMIGSLIRGIRIASFFIALFLPSAYIATLTFHPELLPTKLLLTVAASRERIPFPAFVEVVIMETVFEALREAGLRMPRPLGPALSIVGALVLGDAAIRAGLASPATVLVVALTGIASFAIPVFSAAIAIRIIRFAIMLAAAVMGLYGVMIALLIVLVHLTSLRSFGMPYFMPLAPLIARSLADIVVRAPWWALRKRPPLISQEDEVRQAPGLRPGPRWGPSRSKK